VHGCAWIKRMLERLKAVSLRDSRTAMRAVDGAWWDSEKRIPDWTRVKRRPFETGPLLFVAAAAERGADRPDELVDRHVAVRIITI